MSPHATARINCSLHDLFLYIDSPSHLHLNTGDILLEHPRVVDSRHRRWTALEHNMLSECKDIVGQPALRQPWFTRRNLRTARPPHPPVVPAGVGSDVLQASAVYLNTSPSYKVTSPLAAPLLLRSVWSAFRKRKRSLRHIRKADLRT
jgi:hypothetical protein